MPVVYQVEHPNGDIEYRDDSGELHRTDGGPSLCTTHSMCWHQYGLLHRTEGPAVIYPDGTGEMWIHGRFLYNVPIDRETVNAAKSIQQAWREHISHEAFKPGSVEYNMAKTRWESTKGFRRKVSETELIFPQM